MVLLDMNKRKLRERAEEKLWNLMLLASTSHHKAALQVIMLFLSDSNYQVVYLHLCFSKIITVIRNQKHKLNIPSREV